MCRDRAGAYAEGARTGAPDAVQVADRWHLWHNLAEHVEKTVARHRGCWAHPTESSPNVDPGADPSEGPSADPGVAADPQQLAEQAAIARREASALVTRTRERYTAVQNLRAQGKGIKTIMRELVLAKETSQVAPWPRMMDREPGGLETARAHIRVGRASKDDGCVVPASPALVSLCCAMAMSTLPPVATSGLNQGKRLPCGDSAVPAMPRAVKPRRNFDGGKRVRLSSTAAFTLRRRSGFVTGQGWGRIVVKGHDTGFR